MQQEIEQIRTEAETAIKQASDLHELDNIRVKYLGKKGLLTDKLKMIGQLPADERPRMGERINTVKQILQTAIESRRQELEHEQLEKRLAHESIDVTLPGRGCSVGAGHPLVRTRRVVDRLFKSMGFEHVTGPEIENEFHNFEALNIPPYHPARAMQDTFYLPGGSLLRTHTSNVQVRTMLDREPPLRIISDGRVYRRDLDPTHTPMFHQLEGLWVDRSTTFAHLKGIMAEFLQSFFDKPELKMRFRPSYFPFTEPSAEVDIECLHCQGEQCSLCKGQGWLEILGCGMVDPEVFQSVNIDPDHFQGFAFGMGLDRLALLRYGIHDLRLLFDNDIAMLEQFEQGFW